MFNNLLFFIMHAFENFVQCNKLTIWFCEDTNVCSFIQFYPGQGHIEPESYPRNTCHEAGMPLGGTSVHCRAQYTDSLTLQCHRFTHWQVGGGKKLENPEETKMDTGSCADVTWVSVLVQ